MTETIARLEVGPRMSRVVVHGEQIHLAGVVSSTRADDIRKQTADVLAQIDRFLALADSDKTKIISAQIWLRDIDRDFDGMNEIWDAWVPEGATPARATCQARLGKPDMLVEIIIVAAV